MGFQRRWRRQPCGESPSGCGANACLWPGDHTSRQRPRGFLELVLSIELSKITGASRHSQRNRHVQTGRKGGSGGREYGRGDRCRRGHTERTPNDRGLIWHRRAENQPRRDRQRPSNVPHDPLPPSSLRACHWSKGCALAFGRTRVRISEGFRRCRPLRRRQAIRSVSGASRSASSMGSRQLQPSG